MTIQLHTVTAALERIAPPQYAESWDNVGLLIGPTRRTAVRRAMLTIDLTEAVLDEAIATRADLVIAYHPPIFHPLKQLAPATGPQRIVVRAIENNIAVYCPHTALDAAPGGVNDWLASGLGHGRVEPIQRRSDPVGQQFKLVIYIPVEAADRLHAALSEAGAGVIGDYTHCAWAVEGTGRFRGGTGTHPAVGRPGRLESVREVRLEMVCPAQALPAVAAAIARHHPYEEPAWDVYRLADKPLAATGQGRTVTLDRPVQPATMIRRIKKHLGLRQVRMAGTADAPIASVALCAGAGGSVLCGQPADLYLTGEMRHHDILAANARGTIVILTDHTHTERPYLPVLQRRLAEMLKGKIDLSISKRDAEPLRIV